MTPSESLAAARLHVRAAGATRTLTVNDLSDSYALQFQVLDHFAEQAYRRWWAQPETEECYVLPARGAAPYEKRVTLTLSSPHYLDMEGVLRLKAPAEPPVFTRERPIHVWKAPLAPRMFAAALVPGVSPTAPVELLVAAQYNRVMALSSPLLWTGEIRLAFAFPAPFFETKLRRGVYKCVEPRGAVVEAAP